MSGLTRATDWVEYEVDRCERGRADAVRMEASAQRRSIGADRMYDCSDIAFAMREICVLGIIQTRRVCLHDDKYPLFVKVPA